MHRPTDANCDMLFRFATTDDAPALAAMNQALIRDEGHRSPMTLPELEKRMARWLLGGYRGVVFSLEEAVAGYALYRHEPDYYYLRQFYVRPEFRRRGLGREAVRWLAEQVWRDDRVRLEVLVGNAAAIAFWRAVGFRDYCLALELDSPPRP